MDSLRRRVTLRPISKIGAERRVHLSMKFLGIRSAIVIVGAGVVLAGWSSSAAMREYFR